MIKESKAKAITETATIMGLYSLLFVLPFLSSVSASITDCDPASVFRLTQLTFTPDPPVPGAPSEIALQFTNTGPVITDGQELGTINYNGLPYSYQQPLCAITQCPIGVGSQERRNTTDWPSMTGKMTIQVNWVGPAQESLLCYKIVAKVAALASTASATASATAVSSSSSLE